MVTRKKKNGIKEDTTMKKKNILTMAALLMASATFVACSSEDNMTGEQAAQPKGHLYTMTINATKGGDATTRALTLDGKTLNASWATTENVYVKKSGGEWAWGSLKPQSNGKTAVLNGSFSVSGISTNDVLTLQFPREGEPDYSRQVGTLEDIAANFDYAKATVTVAQRDATGEQAPSSSRTSRPS